MNDPYLNALRWIMDVNESAGNVVAFYFIPFNTSPFDAVDPINTQRVSEILFEAHPGVTKSVFILAMNL